MIYRRTPHFFVSSSFCTKASPSFSLSDGAITGSYWQVRSPNKVHCELSKASLL